MRRNETWVFMSLSIFLFFLHRQDSPGSQTPSCHILSNTMKSCTLVMISESQGSSQVQDQNEPRSRQDIVIMGSKSGQNEVQMKAQLSQDRKILFEAKSLLFGFFHTLCQSLGYVFQNQELLLVKLCESEKEKVYLFITNFDQDHIQRDQCQK